MKAQGYIRGIVSAVLILTVQLQAQASNLGNFLIPKPGMAQSSPMILPFAGVPVAMIQVPGQTPAPTASSRPQETPSAVKPAQSSTLLPDGQILLLGGLGADHKPVADAYLMDRAGKTQKIAAQLHAPRAGHTATVLPDGTVLIFGGVNASGDTIGAAEIYDPAAQNFSPVSSRLVPRAFHSATLLTDGTLLIAGGVEQNHVFSTSVQKWDYRTGQVTAFDALLAVPRQGHQRNSFGGWHGASIRRHGFVWQTSECG